MDLLKVALRNMGRNTRRSVITALTVFIGIVVVCSTRGLLNGLQDEIKSGLTRKIHGDLQIHLKDYRNIIDADPYKVLFPMENQHLNALRESKALQSIAPRLRVMGLLNHQKSQTSTPVMIVGIDSSRELSVCPRLKDAIQQGELIKSELEKKATSKKNIDDDLIAATPLDSLLDDGTLARAKVDAADSYHQIMITPALMNGLKASLGDEIVILVQDKDNMQQAIVTHIVGVVDYALPTAASRMAWMDLSTLQTLTKSTGYASELALATSPGIPLLEAKQKIGMHLPPGTMIETWMELSSFLGDVLGLQNIIFAVVVTVVFVIMIFAVINTSLMTVMERTREIGTLAALGYRRKHIMFLFLTEASAISLLGGLLGVIAALSLIGVLNVQGIEFALPGQKVATVLHPYIPWSFVLLALGLAFFSALIAAFVPSFRASHMKPVEALSKY